MKIDTQTQEDHQIKLTVEIESETLEGSKRKAAKKIAKKIKIPGFRPGKAPYNVIQKHVGDGAILEDALDILLEDIYPKIIDESDIKPYGPGSLQNANMDLEPPTFEFMVPLAPEVELGNYREIRIDFQEKEVTQEEIDKVLNNMRDTQAVIEQADRPAEEGDMVYIILSGEKLDEEDEEKKSIVEERKFPVLIEKEDVDNSDEWPFPGFSRKLLGLSAGDEKKYEYEFDEEYDYEELQGIKASYNVIVEEIKSRILPEVDDDFAKSVGEYETKEKLIEEIKNTLIKQFEQETNSEYESNIIEKVVEESELKYPPQMLDHEIDHFLDDLLRQLQNQGLDMDVYLKSRELEMEELRQELKPSAEERLKRGLVLMEVANKENISVTPEEVEDQTQKTISEINRILPQDQARKLTTGDALQGLISRIITDEITQRTLTRLRKVAKGEKIEEEESEEIQDEETDSGEELEETDQPSKGNDEIEQDDPETNDIENDPEN